MNLPSSRQLQLVSLLFGAAIVFTATASAKTHTATRAGTFSNNKGGSGTFSSSTTRGDGSASTQGSWTNQNGQTGTHSSNRSFDKATGTGTVAKFTTLPDGKTASTNGTLAKNPDGSISEQATRTGFNGKSETIATTTAKTATGTTTTGTITGPDGKVATISGTMTKGADTYSRDTTITGPNGKTTEHASSTVENPDGSYTRTAVTTKPDGSTSTNTENFTVTKDTPPKG